MLRLVFSPRWIGWHLLTLGAMAGCVWASIWQWQVAGTALGSAQNVGYGLQWPVFAVFFAFIWWRFLRLELAQLAEQKAAGGTAAEGGDAALPEEGQATVPAEVASAPAADAQRPPAPWESGPSPFTRTPARGASRPAVLDEEASPALAEYNRLLAELAERDRADRQG